MFATYAVRTSLDRLPLLKSHWEHHRPLCLNGVVCLDADCQSEETIEEIKSWGLNVVLPERVSLNNNDYMRDLQNAGNNLPGEWFLTLDSDEFIPDNVFSWIQKNISSNNGTYQWMKGWMCDRFAPGGHLIPLPEDLSYLSLCRTFPVPCTFTRDIQKSCIDKCIIAKKPYIGKVHGYGNSNSTKPFPGHVRLDHFKWYQGVIEYLTKRTNDYKNLNLSWWPQHQRMLDHHKTYGRMKVESCLVKLWEKPAGWFDFEGFYWDILRSLAKTPTKKLLVEVGVFHGKSALYLTLLSKALGIVSDIYLIDRYRDAAYIGKNPNPGGDPNGDYLPITKSEFKKYNIDSLVNFVRSDSDVAANEFNDSSCDLVFIDADHSYHSVTRDIQAWLPKVASGGFLAGHDYNWPSVHSAVNDQLKSQYRIRTSHGHTWWIQKT